MCLILHTVQCDVVVWSYTLQLVRPHLKSSTELCFPLKVLFWQGSWAGGLIF